jgi:SAM-dependent methyltransferase
MSPLSNAFLSEKQLGKMEAFFPLETFVCSQCFLVQLDAFEAPDKIFSEYVYFSSYSTSWLKHAEKYAERMIEEKKLNDQSMVVEIASNDGYLLQYFVKKNIPVLGIEPAANVAEVAIKERGVRSISEFFGETLGRRLAKEGFQADLMAANNVLAHVPDLNDFVRGFKALLKPDGIATFEFPHLKRMIEENQFDTIYHEHFSYFSLLAVAPVFKRAGLEVFDVEELPTHGGSLRVFVKHQENSALAVSGRVAQLIETEKSLGYGSLKLYEQYRNQVVKVKQDLLQFLIEAKKQGKTVVGYGAAAKGNTLLNYCGIREDFIDFVTDMNPHKQGKYLPGVHIPVRDVEALMNKKPDFVMILPWNLRSEIQNQLSGIRVWGGKFVVAIPKLEVF